MSSTFVAVCKNCNKVGPKLHRSSWSVFLWPSDKIGGTDAVFAQAEWHNWLIDHERCDFVIESHH